MDAAKLGMRDEVFDLMAILEAGGEDENETDKGRLDELKAAAAYFAALATDGAAAVLALPTKGSVFSEVNIDGVNLRAFVSNGLFLGHTASASAAEFGKTGLQKVGADWWVVECGHERLFCLHGMTDAGAKAAAIHFGLTISGLVASAPEPAEYFGEMEAFYSGAAYADLVEWARLHPRKAKKGGGSPYLGDWGANAYADARKVPQEA